MLNANPLRALTLAVLGDPTREWQVQGLGMLRTYLQPEVRLHIWHNSLRYKETHAAEVRRTLSIHNHPWDFSSTVICGEITNIIYRHAAPGAGFREYQRIRIRCGADPDLPPEQSLGDVFPLVGQSCALRAGESYTMRADELHETNFIDGTVTIVTRHFRPELDDMADIYCQVGREWIGAEPRIATPNEIGLAISAARVQLTGLDPLA